MSAQLSNESTERAAGFISGVHYEDLPGPVREKTKMCILDLLGVAIGGSATTACRIAAGFGLETLGGKSASGVTLIGRTERATYPVAAWINSVAGSALDMDDDADWGHPASVIIPAALAVGEERRVSGQRLILAVACAYEIAMRIADARVPGTILSYATGPWGIYGAAVAAAQIMGLPEEKTMHALGIAGAHAPLRPPSRSYETIPMFKECIGWAALSGVSAAALAEQDFTGFTDILDYTEFFYPGQIRENLGQDYLIMDVGFKPYSSCRWSHTSIDAVLDLVQENNIEAEEVEGIRIYGYERASVMKYPFPETSEAAQYSIPFCVGAAILDRQVGPEQVDEKRLRDPRIRSLAEKVEILHEPSFTAEYPAKLKVRVELAARGQVFRRTVERPRGDKTTPFTEDELIDKFRRLSVPILGPSRTDEIAALALGLEEVEDVSQLGQLLGK